MRKLILLGLIICLSGCAGMNSTFDCNVSSGGKCLPMDRINQMADQSAFNGSSVGAGVVKGEVAASNAAYGYPLKAYKGQPIRYGETVQQVWVAPYIDSTGNYHEPSYVYSVVKKGHWIGEPVKAVQN